MNSRSKGARGEREWRDVLRAAGFRARRGQQYSGDPDAPDVVCKDLPRIAFEVKRCQKVELGKWMIQAVEDAGTEKIPVIAHRRNNEDWMVTMLASDWLEMVKETDHPVINIS